MAKIVIAWNQHPVEVLGGVHARKVAELLRKKGHEVTIRKISPNETNYGILTKNNTEDAISKFYNDHIRGFEFNKTLTDNPNAFVFNFHSSTPIGLGQAAKGNAKRFRVKWTNSNETPERATNAEIILIGNKKEKHFVVEVPAIHKPMPKHLRTVNKIKILDFFFVSKHKKDRMEGNEKEEFIKKVGGITHPTYYLYRDKLKDNTKFTQDIISKKIANAIHKRVTR